MIKRILSALAVALVSGFVASAQEYKGPELTPEFVCDLGQITPENVKVKGSTQGFAIWGKYGFVLHDKGQCVIIDMKKNKFVSSFKLDGNKSHCNNASFGVEKDRNFRCFTSPDAREITAATSRTSLWMGAGSFRNSFTQGRATQGRSTGSSTGRTRSSTPMGPAARCGN